MTSSTDQLIKSFVSAKRNLRQGKTTARRWQPDVVLKRIRQAFRRNVNNRVRDANKELNQEAREKARAAKS